jgi:hypothetical protein
MEVKLKLTDNEYKDLVSFCNLNDLLLSSVVKDSFTTGYNIEKYGLLNAGPKVTEKIVEKEVIKYVEVPKIEEKEVVKIEYVEVLKEIPVEKIIEKERVVEKPVEIIKEVPVERVVVQEVIKEVPVEKVVYVTDQEEMRTKIFQKEQEFEEQRVKFSNKTTEMENIFQNEKNNLLSKIQELENTPPKIIEVIKEVIVETKGNDDWKLKLEALQNTVQKLKQDNIEKDKKIKEYEKTIQDIQKFQEDRKAAFLRGSNLDDKLYK